MVSYVTVPATQWFLLKIERIIALTQILKKAIQRK